MMMDRALGAVVLFPCDFLYVNEDSEEAEEIDRFFLSANDALLLYAGCLVHDEISSTTQKLTKEIDGNKQRQNPIFTIPTRY